MVTEGENQARQCTTAFDEILGQVETLDRLIGDIVQASLEQNKGIGEISEAMNEINASSAQNSTLLESGAERGE